MSNVQSFVDALKACEATTLKAPKLAALTGINEQAKRLMFEALSPYRVFGVKKYDMPHPAEVDADAEIFLAVLDKLASRELTGNAARDALFSALSNYTAETQKYLARVISKDLSAGFSETTLHKLYPGLVERFGCMLAYKVDESYEWTFPVLAEAKYDGTRTIAIVEGSNVTYYSRNGKIAENAVGLFDEDLTALRNYYGTDMAFDGEALAGSFQETLNAKASGNKAAKANVKYYVFDAIPLSNWKLQDYTERQDNRSNKLEASINAVKPNKVVKSKSHGCQDYSDVREFFTEMLAEGYEGLIVKKPDALYTWDRDNAWAKIKPVNTYDGTIVGFYEGRGRNVGRLGGINIEGTDENGNYFESNVGSGFSDDMRHEIWNNKEKYLGKTAEVEAQELSKSDARDCHSLRFPIFIKIRWDK